MDPGPDLVVRPGPRVLPPAPPSEPVVIAAPPETGEHEPGGGLQAVLPMLGGVGVLGYAVVSHNLAFLVAGLITAVIAAAGSVAVRRSQLADRRRRRAAVRDRYRVHLDDRAAAIRSGAAAQRAHQEALYPSPAGRRALVADRCGLWWRRPGDPGFGTARIGTGAAAPAGPVRLESGGPLACPEPDLWAAARRVAATGGAVTDVPLALDLLGPGTVTLAGDASRTRAFARALLLDLATSHGPDLLRIVGLVPTAAVADWEWIKWLPHAREGARPTVVTAADRFGELIGRGAGDDGWTLALVDHPAPTLPLPVTAAVTKAEAEAGARVSVLLLVGDLRSAPARSGACASFDRDGTVRVSGPGGVDLIVARPDLATVDEATGLGRALAPLRTPTCARQRTDKPVRLLDLLGTGADVDVRAHWRPAGDRPLRAVIGVDRAGVPVGLDLGEPAAGGDGPHGLVVGATGSGKSELLRTLVTSLAVGHAPDRLALLMVDFKGGAAFTELAALPHAVGVVTNLEEDAAAVERLAAALRGEVSRRQRVLRDAGAGAGVDVYRAIRDSRPELDPLPSLLVVVDEFAELLGTHPDLHDLVATLGRIGRSLGIHLLLASQRIDEGRLQGLAGHLRYRLCLRTAGAAESLAAIGSDAAFRLAPTPGRGYLSVDGRSVALTVAAVGRQATGPARTRPTVQAFDLHPPDADGDPAEDAEPGDRTGRPAGDDPGDAADGGELGRLVASLARGARDAGHPPPRAVVTPPLPSHLPLAGVLRDRVPGERELGDRDRLRVPVGRLDLPELHDQPPLVLDLRGGGGNVAVVGAPRSGRSTLLTTLALGLAATHTAAEVQLYAIDLGGGGLGAVGGLPHTGHLCGRYDDERMRALAEQIRRVTTGRTRRGPRRRGDDWQDGYGEVFVLVDNWERLRGPYDDVEETLGEIAVTGLEVGVHLAVSAGRWVDLRPAVREAFGTRLELRLNDPMESEQGRRTARRLHGAPPGRGVTATGHTFQTARAGPGPGLPPVPPRRDPGDRPAPPVLLLPAIAALPAGAGRRGPEVHLGIGLPDLAPTGLRLLADEPLLLVLGDPRSGRTTALAAVLAQLLRRQDRDRLRIHVVDPRATLADRPTDTHVRSPADAAALALTLAGAVTDGPPGVRHVLLVDDHDLIAGPTTSPLSPLADLLPVASDVGLSMVLARRTGGFGRSVFEPVLARFADLGAPALVLSGDPGEGPVHGGALPRILRTGRAQWVRRGRPTVLTQLFTPPPPTGPGATR